MHGDSQRRTLRVTPPGLAAPVDSLEASAHRRLQPHGRRSNTSLGVVLSLDPGCGVVAPPRSLDQHGTVHCLGDCGVVAPPSRLDPHGRFLPDCFAPQTVQQSHVGFCDLAKLQKFLRPTQSAVKSRHGSSRENWKRARKRIWATPRWATRCCEALPGPGRETGRSAAGVDAVSAAATTSSEASSRAAGNIYFVALVVQQHLSAEGTDVRTACSSSEFYTIRTICGTTQ